MLWRALDDESETVLAKRTLPVRSGDGVPTQLRLHAQAPEDPQFESVALVLAVGELRTDCERLDDELLERHGPSTGERIVVAYNGHDSLRAEDFDDGRGPRGDRVVEHRVHLSLVESDNQPRLPPDEDVGRDRRMSAHELLDHRRDGRGGACESRADHDRSGLPASNVARPVYGLLGRRHRDLRL